MRGEAREVGGPLVECAPGAGARAVLIEDVVAGGGRAAAALRALRAETSQRVTGVLSIANWNYPQMRELLAPWPVRALTSYPQVLASAQAAGLVSAVGVAGLRRFYADPQRHSWRLGTKASGGVLSVGSRQAGGDRRGRRRGDDPAGEDGMDEVREGVGGERGADQEDGR